MPEHHQTALSGKVTHVFAHRFVVETARGAILADLTPHGVEQIALHVGDEVSLEGEMKPSELKVAVLRRGGRSVHIEHKKKHHDDHHSPADPALALEAVRAAGFEILGEPQRKPKHFEVLGRRGKAWTEFHVELDGHIRKTKPVERDDHKWAEVLDAR